MEAAARPWLISNLELSPYSSNWNAHPTPALPRVTSNHEGRQLANDGGEGRKNKNGEQR